MTKRISRERLRKIHSLTNPEIDYNLFEWNYGWLQVEAGHSLIITENRKAVLKFMRGQPYFDSRKPNERQTTD